jgi:adenylate cyclase
MFKIKREMNLAITEPIYTLPNGSYGKIIITVNKLYKYKSCDSYNSNIYNSCIKVIDTNEIYKYISNKNKLSLSPFGKKGLLTKIKDKHVIINYKKMI